MEGTTGEENRLSLKTISHDGIPDDDQVNDIDNDYYYYYYYDYFQFYRKLPITVL